MSSSWSRRWAKEHPLQARIFAVVMLGFGALMFASRFWKLEQTRNIPHSYVVTAIALADVWLVAFAVGMWRRTRTGSDQKVGPNSKYFTPAMILALPVVMGMPRSGRYYSPGYLFPPRYQIVGDAVGVVVATTLLVCLTVATVRLAKSQTAETSSELIEG